MMVMGSCLSTPHPQCLGVLETEDWPRLKTSFTMLLYDQPQKSQCLSLASRTQVKTSNKHQALVVQVVSASTKKSICPAFAKRLSKIVCNSFAEEKRVPDLTGSKMSSAGPTKLVVLTLNLSHEECRYRSFEHPVYSDLKPSFARGHMIQKC